MNPTPLAPHHSFVYDGTRMNVFYANKGEGLPRHSHSYSHGTICVAGSCAIRKDGVEVISTKDSKPINLGAVDWHEIEALEDNTVFVNIFADGKY